MAPEMSKNVKLFGDQGVTSQQRDQIDGAGAGGEEEQVSLLPEESSAMAMALHNYLCDQSGLNFESINMDLLMDNIWKIDEFEAVNAACVERAAVMGVGGSGGGERAEEGALIQQGSFSFPAPLSQNMLDQEWADIIQELELVPAPAPTHAMSGPLLQSQTQLGSGGVVASGQQATLGLMTMDEFLAKAGMNEGSSSSQVHVPTGLITGSMIPMQPAPMMFPVPPANAMYPVMGDGMGYHGGGKAVVPPFQGALVAEVSPGSSDGMSAMVQANMMNRIGSGSRKAKGARKRYAREMYIYDDMTVEIERRMLKNRDSSARSRARKRAYIMELQAELRRLKEDNASLRAEEKTIQLAKKQMLVEKMMEQSKENVNARKGGPLRRSGSCIW